MASPAGSSSRRGRRLVAAWASAASPVTSCAAAEQRQRSSRSVRPLPDSAPRGNPGSGVASFVTSPDLQPRSSASPTVQSRPSGRGLAAVHRAGADADVPYKDVQRGPMLLDRHGRMVWYEPGPDSTFDVQIQQYKGKPVLTRWHGKLVGGYGEGVGEIIDELVQHRRDGRRRRRSCRSTCTSST